MPDGDQLSRLYYQSECSRLHLPGRQWRLAEGPSCPGNLPTLLSHPLSLPLSLFLHAGLIAGPSGMQTLNSLLQLNNKKINLALNPRPLVLLILVTKQSNYCTQKP